LQQEIQVGTDNYAKAASLFRKESSMHTRPSGTVTFLFTDIEGSTKLWEQNPNAMRPALARHDVLLRDAIENSHGYVFKTVGDAFCAAFGTAPDALAGAVSAQMALAAEPWETEKPILVRMALHTGSAEERGGDYFGPPLNRVARLMAAGHGGQTLLSLAAQQLLGDALPSEVTLKDLGERRLKDLSRPETVFQALHPALPDNFPPLRSLDNPALPNNLPQQLTSFIGCETQAAEVKALLGKSRLLTLTGAGGGGKTRLSLQVAADLLDQYFDGVWLVELAPLSDPALVPQVVAGVLGIKEQPGQTMQQSLTDALKDKRLLLVLDNCEHLIATCASLAADLLRHCPGIRILASSRELLSVTGEQMYRVPSLSLPDLKKTQTALSVSQYEAVALAVQDSHLSWCVALAEEAEPQLRGTEQVNWLRRLETDHDNLRASLAWDERTWVQSAAGGELGLRLAGALWRFWSSGGHLLEGYQWLNRALARTGDASAGTKAAATQGKALRGAGHLARMQGDYAEAQILLEESLSIVRQLGDQWSAADTLNSLGTVAHCQVNYAGARVLYEESLSILRQLGNREDIAGDLEGMADVALEQSLPERAARLGSAAAALRERLGCPLYPLVQKEFDNLMATAAAALGEMGFAAAEASGRAMTWEQAVEYALEGNTE
jgi:class 3 adenylate cyclase/tetratricopeptide (TPR) repeat protein